MIVPTTALKLGLVRVESEYVESLEVNVEASHALTSS